jgi:uncharacterized membrane protein required for colicin V production
MLPPGVTIGGVNDFDLVVLALIGVGGVLGLIRGTLREALGLVHLLAAGGLALAFSDEARTLVQKVADLPADDRSDLIPWTAGFLLLFVFGFGLLLLLRPLTKRLRFPGDRIPGFVLGAARSAVLVLCLLPLVLWIAPDSGSIADRISESRALPAAERASRTGAGRLLVPAAYTGMLARRLREPGP